MRSQKTSHGTVPWEVLHLIKKLKSKSERKKAHVPTVIFGFGLDNTIAFGDNIVQNLNFEKLWVLVRKFSFFHHNLSFFHPTGSLPWGFFCFVRFLAFNRYYCAAGTSTLVNLVDKIFLPALVIA